MKALSSRLLKLFLCEFKCILVLLFMLLLYKTHINSLAIVCIYGVHINCHHCCLHVEQQIFQCYHMYIDFQGLSFNICKEFLSSAWEISFSFYSQSLIYSKLSLSTIIRLTLFFHYFYWMLACYEYMLMNNA